MLCHVNPHGAVDLKEVNGLISKSPTKPLCGRINKFINKK